jgi:hypothetical protein
MVKNNNANVISDWMADIYRLLKMDNWQGRTARVLLGTDIVLWSLLIYFIIDYQVYFVA